MSSHTPMPAPSFAASRRLGFGVAAAGAVGAIALPVWDTGLGWPLTAAFVAGAVTAVRSGAGRRRLGSSPSRWWRIGAAIAAVALVAVAGIRDAGWLVGLCLGTAVALMSYALVGGTTWRTVGYGVTALPTAGLRSLAWAVTKYRHQLWRALLGLAVGVVLLLVFGYLFAAAEPSFVPRLRDVAQATPGTEIVRGPLGFALAALGTLSVVYLLSLPRVATTSPAPPTRRTMGTAVWVIPLAMLIALFGIFVSTQLSRLFGGDALVLDPTGPSYAEYARGGFMQLLVVTLLTLGVVVVLARWVSRETRTERILLRTLGGALGALTLVIVASAAKRMDLYADAYGFNLSRLLGLTGEMWLGVVFVLILTAGVRLRASWLPRVVVTSGVAMLLGLAAMNPEAQMARTHIDRLDRGYQVDQSYLASLSADAVTEIDRLPEPTRSCVLQRLAHDLAEPEPWYRLNISRQRARALIASRPVRLPAPEVCDIGGYAARW